MSETRITRDSYARVRLLATTVMMIAARIMRMKNVHMDTAEPLVGAKSALTKPKSYHKGHSEGGV